MKTNRVSLKLATLLIGTALTSCIDGNKKRIPTQFIHPDLNIDYIKKTNSKGVGYVKKVELTDSIDQYLVKKGKFVFEMKCSSCHKLTDQRLVGPGWAGITNNRRPEWIMNMITNTDEMLEKDEAAKTQLEDCLTRMPNQDITLEQARSILEFMRKNDLDQVDHKDGAANKTNY